MGYKIYAENKKRDFFVNEYCEDDEKLIGRLKSCLDDVDTITIERMSYRDCYAQWIGFDNAEEMDKYGKELKGE